MFRVKVPLTFVWLNSQKPQPRLYGNKKCWRVKAIQFSLLCLLCRPQCSHKVQQKTGWNYLIFYTLNPLAVIQPGIQVMVGLPLTLSLSLSLAVQVLQHWPAHIQQFAQFFLTFGLNPPASCTNFMWLVTFHNIPSFLDLI